MVNSRVCCSRRFRFMLSHYFRSSLSTVDRSCNALDMELCDPLETVTIGLYPFFFFLFVSSFCASFFTMATFLFCSDLSRFKKVLVRQQERSRKSANVLVQADGEEVAAESGQDPRTTTGSTSPISRELRQPNAEPLAFHTAHECETDDDQEKSNNGGTGAEAGMVTRKVLRNAPGCTTAAADEREGDENNIFDDTGDAALESSAQEQGDTTTCSVKDKDRQSNLADGESSSAVALETKNRKTRTNGRESGTATGWFRRRLWQKLRRKSGQHQQRHSGDGVEGDKGSHDTLAIVKNGGDLRTPWSRRWRRLLRCDL